MKMGADPERPVRLLNYASGRGQDMTADLFAASVKRAIAQDLNVNTLLEAIEQLGKSGETSLVIELYQIWIKHNPAHPLLYAICFNYGVILSDAGELHAAKEAFQEAIRLNPNFWPPYINLGTLLERLGAAGEAVQLWTKIVNSLPAITGEAIFHKLTALKQIGRVLEGGRIEINAEEALRMSLDIDPRQHDVVQHYVALRQGQCKWPVIEPWDRCPRRHLMEGISPLSLAAYTDDPMFQLASACAFYRHDIADRDQMYTAGGWAVPDKPLGRRLRIGYLSSDLREHAVGFATVSMFELHDRERFEIFAYYCGVPSPDSTQQRARNGVDHWIDISRMTDRQAARQIADDGIDILIDFNGYTKDARTKVLAMRPAPIIVNWFGFPGTMGSPIHNYLVADDIIIPKGAEIYYSEKVVRLPCYQPNDRHCVISPRRPTRAEAGLPENATVFCSFNGLQKLTRFTFARWMSILKQVPDSVMWSMSGSDATQDRLRKVAQDAGVAPERLIFAPKMANPDHLARYVLADLFLDTSPYGAHTTASDALWMGVPILTVPGRCFAARVCASLLHAAGLDELVCRTPQEYVERAVALGRDRAKLAEYRRFLLENRNRSVLFDTDKLVRGLEALYQEMWADYASGALPQPDLTNLDIYQQIGCDIDHEAAELLTVADYEGLYRLRLAYRHAFEPIPADERLWPEGMGGERSVSEAASAAIDIAAEAAGAVAVAMFQGGSSFAQLSEKSAEVDCSSSVRIARVG